MIVMAAIVENQPELVKKTVGEILQERQFSRVPVELNPASSPDPLSHLLREIAHLPLVRQVGACVEKLLKPLQGVLDFIMAKLNEGDLYWYALLIFCTMLLLLLVLQIYGIIKKNIVVQVEKEKIRHKKTGIIKIDRLEDKAAASIMTLDFMRAIKTLYLAMLLTVNERSPLNFLLSSTNREIEHQLETLTGGEALGAFHRCTAIFDDAVYAGKTLNHTLFLEFNTYYEIFKRTF
jgi:hypothetical protein